MKNALLLALLAALCSLTTTAQEKLTLDNIKYVSLRNSGIIVESDELKGYFFYYVSDKLDRSTNEYTIQILDENLAPVRKVVFEDDKNEQLLESSYNANSLIFMFFNKSAKTITYKVYGLDGKLRFTYSKEMDKKSVNFFIQDIHVSGEEGENRFIHDIEDKGYISVTPEREGREYSYEIDIYLSQIKKQLTYTPIENESRFSVPTYLGCTDSLAIFEVIKKSSPTSSKYESFLLAINLFNGRKSFELPTETNRYKYFPLSISNLHGQSDFLLLGTYYDKDEKVLKDKTTGIAAVTMTNEGQITSEKYDSWADDMGKYLKLNSRGAIEDIGYLYFHKIIQTEDGNIFAIGEGYKKTANAAGIAMTALSAMVGGYSSSNSVTKLLITDMVIIKFDSRFNVIDGKIYLKNRNSFVLPGGDYMSPHMMAEAAKTRGAYDYEFTRTDRFHTNFYVGYNDYERTKEYTGLTFHSIAYNNGGFTTDKIDLTSKANSMRVLPGKAGFILITEYFKKEKKINLRLEKLN
jgi:hypothetical protein